MAKTSLQNTTLHWRVRSFAITSFNMGDYVVSYGLKQKVEQERFIVVCPRCRQGRSEERFETRGLGSCSPRKFYNLGSDYFQRTFQQKKSEGKCYPSVEFSASCNTNSWFTSKLYYNIIIITFPSKITENWALVMRLTLCRGLGGLSLITENTL